MRQRLFRNAACILCFFALHTPFGPGQVPVVQKTTAEAAPSVAPPARSLPPAAQRRGSRGEDGKAAPSVAIREASITRTADGLWRWQVEFSPTISRRIEPHTVKVRVWQNAHAERMLVDTRVYDRPVIPPAGGMLQNAFFPCGPEDALLFELIEVKAGGDGPSPNAENVVDRRTAALPPLDVKIEGHRYTLTDPRGFSVGLKNDSPWPLLVRLVLRGGPMSAWTRIRHTEHLIIPARATAGVRHAWEFTDKGMGKYMCQLETQFKDAATGRVLWKEMEHQEGNLPMNR